MIIEIKDNMASRRIECFIDGVQTVANYYGDQPRVRAIDAIREYVSAKIAMRMSNGATDYYEPAQRGEDTRATVAAAIRQHLTEDI